VAVEADQVDLETGEAWFVLGGTRESSDDRTRELA
jgi:hypothetical protein